jgi:hypothetical protein
LTGDAETQKEWPEKRLRFVTRRSARGDATARLGGVSVVTFVPMEAIGDRGELDVSAVRELQDVRNGYRLTPYRCDASFGEGREYVRGRDDRGVQDLSSRRNS